MAGSHEDVSRTHVVKGSTNRGFGLVFAILFALVGLSPLIRAAAPRWGVLAVAGVLLLITWLAPALLTIPKRAWLCVGLVLHRMISPLALGVLFYGVVTPMAVVMRRLGKDSMRRRREPAQASYWIKRDPPGPQPDSLIHQF
jgi:hypothetical protein